MDELDKKRKDNYYKKNNRTILDMLYFIANKEEVKAQQETFEVDSIQKFRRMEELMSEIYTDSILVLRAIDNAEHSNSTYLTVLKVTDKKKLPYVINELLNDHLGEKYRLTEELLIWPKCLSFSNDEEKLFLMPYDSGTIEV